jgi:hypothetical protein
LVDGDKWEEEGDTHKLPNMTLQVIHGQNNYESPFPLCPHSVFANI